MPRLGMLQLQCVNSEYTFATDQLKNCYLIMNAVRNEDCMYGRDLYDNDDCVDCDHLQGSELCYECLNCKNCYNSNFLQDSENCRDCNYGYDLKACNNCIGCVGLRRKEYHIFNTPYSKEDFFKKALTLTSQEIKAGFEELTLHVPRVYAYATDSENFIGNYIHNSKNAYFCFDVKECEDVGYLLESKNLRDSYDISILEDSEMCYEVSSAHVLNNCNFCFMCVSSSDLEYCEFVMNSKHCFGCISLNHREYHILNEPYSKSAYFKKVAEIKDELRRRNEYGRRFLPAGYPYENTVATWPRM